VRTEAVSSEVTGLFIWVETIGSNNVEDRLLDIIEVI